MTSAISQSLDDKSMFSPKSNTGNEFSPIVARRAQINGLMSAKTIDQSDLAMAY